MNSSVYRRHIGLVVAVSLVCTLLATKAWGQGNMSNALSVVICMSQNWDTPRTQNLLNKMPRETRVFLYSSLKVPSGALHCLMKSKPAPIALCDKVNGEFLKTFLPKLPEKDLPAEKISTEEENTLLQSVETNPCLQDMDQSANSDWLPSDFTLSQKSQDILESAQKGDKAAQLGAIEIYTSGKEIPYDEAKADYWINKAALNGDAHSQFVLGDAYLHETLLHKIDYQEAIRFLTLAANQGHREAMTRLGMLYQDSGPDEGSSHLEKNIPEAINWYGKAAKLGEQNAANYLAAIYENGLPEMPIDLQQALFWYRQGAENMSTAAMLKLGEFYEKGWAVKKDPKEAQKWRRKADSLGVNGTTLNLSNYFPWGLPPSSVNNIIDIQVMHANEGDVDAELAIAQRYFNGIDVEKNEKTAIDWWRKAAQAGDPIGERMLGKALIYGWGTTAHTPDASGVEWLEKAAEEDPEAATTLGYWYINLVTHDAIEKKNNTAKAVQWMRHAANHGYRPAETNAKAALWMTQE